MDKYFENSITERQLRFCEEYTKDCNATQAAIRAGYSPRSAHQIGYENLRKPEIQERLGKLQEETARRNEVTLDEIINDLRRLRDEAFETGSYGAAARAIELLGKTIGAYRDRVDNRTDVTPTVASLFGKGLTEGAGQSRFQYLARIASKCGNNDQGNAHNDNEEGY